MADNVGAIEYEITGDTRGLIKSGKDVTTFNKNASKEFDKTTKSVGGLTTGMKKLGIAIAGALSVGALKTYFTQLSAVVDEQAKFADRIGITFEELQRLEFAASQTGVSVNSLRTGLQRMTRRISEAAQGTGTAKDALEELGLEAEALNKLAPEDQFKAIADSFEDVAEQSDKVRLAMRLFDTEGVALVNTLKGGSEAIEELGGRTEVVSRNAARQFEWLNDQIDLFATNTQATLGNWAADLIRTFRKVFGDDFSPVEEVENQLLDIENAISASQSRIAILQAQQRVLPETIYQSRENTQAFKSLQSQIERQEMLLENAIARKKELEEELGSFEVTRGEGSAGPILETFAGTGTGQAGANAEASGREIGANFIRGFGAALESEDGFATGISAGIIGDNETLLDQLQRQRELIQEFQELEIGDAEKHAQALIEIDKRENMERMRLQMEMLSASAQFFEGSADLIGAFAGESSTAYKALFAISKGFAIANAALQLQTAIANASALPFPANIPAITNAVALGGQIASSIASINYGGGRANGGPVSGNTMYEVGEGNQPELLQVNGRSFMIPGNNGQVFNQSQMQQAGGGGTMTYAPSTVINAKTDLSAQEMQRILDQANEKAMREFSNQMRNKSGPYYQSTVDNTSANARIR